MGKHRDLGKITEGDTVRHLAGWTGTVLEIKSEFFGRRLKVERLDLPGIQWWRETVFTKIRERAAK